MMCTVSCYYHGLLTIRLWSQLVPIWSVDKRLSSTFKTEDACRRRDYFYILFGNLRPPYQSRQLESSWQRRHIMAHYRPFVFEIEYSPPYDMHLKAFLLRFKTRMAPGLPPKRQISGLTQTVFAELVVERWLKKTRDDREARSFKKQLSSTNVPMFWSSIYSLPTILQFRLYP